MTENEYVKSYFNEAAPKVKILAGDASSRKYFRVLNKNGSFILMNYSNDASSIYDFLEVQKFLLSNGINCPQIIDHNKESNLLLMNDLSDYSLEMSFKDNKHFNFYEDTVKQLAILHNIKEPSKTVKSRCFDYEKLFWESEFGIKHINKLYGINDTSARSELSDICKTLGSLPKVVCHRDFHSRNIMIKDNRIHFIDFQDARMGPWQYDVVSLLHDSYVGLSNEEIDSLLNLYLKSIDFELTKDWKNHYSMQLIQRTFKACGSFSSFQNKRNDGRYLKYLPKCFNLLLSHSKNFPAFHKYISLIVNSEQGINT